MTTTPPRPAPQRATTARVDAFAERLFSAVLGAQLVQAIDLGDRLGWYAALAAGGPATSVELAERTGSDERYAREWLEHQAACGVLRVDDARPHRPTGGSRCRPPTPPFWPTATAWRS